MKKIVTKAQYEKVVELFLSGMSYRDIADTVGISEYSVRAEIKRKELNKKDDIEQTELEVYALENRIAELYKEGYTVKQICDEVKKSKGYVSKVLRSRLLLGYTKERMNKVVELYQSGVPVTTLAKDMKMSNRTVSRILNSKGIQTKRAVEWTEDKINSILDMYSNGISINNISKEMRMSNKTVANILKSRGIKTNRLDTLDVKKERVKAIKDLRDKGYTIKEISDKLKLSESQIGHLVSNNKELRVRSFLNSEDSCKIAELYKKGHPTKDIAEQFNISIDRVYKIASYKNIKRIVKNTKVDEAEVCDRYSKGISIEEIAKELNISTTTVLRVAKRNNLKTRRNNIDDSVKDKIIEMKLQGVTLNGIAEKCNVSISTVCRVVANYNKK